MVTIKSLEERNGVWLNKPRIYSFNNNELRLITENNTDFWQKTYYGFQRHTGHAFGFSVDGDFTLQVKIKANFSNLYDQAGIFLQDNENHWVKAGIEFNDGQSSIGSVVTRVTSDWSTGIFPGEPKEFWMRVTLSDEALRIQYSTDAKIWPLLRLCYWPEKTRRFIGIMACTPERQGLEATFSEFILSAPLDKSLHDLT